MSLNMFTKETMTYISLLPDVEDTRGPYIHEYSEATHCNKEISTESQKRLTGAALPEVSFSWCTHWYST
jgi:hypothetical protein